MAPGALDPLSYISSPRRRTSRTASASAQRAGRVVRGELAERMPGGGATRAAEALA